jgi:hypothetical protein
LYFIVQDLPTLLKVCTHFLQYTLQSTKQIHFQLWSQVLDTIAAKQHLTSSGLERIVSIKFHFPLGLSPLLSKAFPSLPSFDKPSFIPSKSDLDSHWIAGFANGDGSFTLSYSKVPRMR